MSPATGHTLRHGGSHTNTVTIDGVDFRSAGTSACVYLDHQGDVVLTDVTANNCGYTAFVLDSLVDSSVGAGIAIAYGGVDIENLLIRRNTITGNGTNGIEFYDVGGPGPFVTTCNDIVGNPTGLFLSDSVTVDARKVWWGNTTGPSGQGPGAGDPIYADPGGTIIFNPWLTDSFISPQTTCELFGSGFETGLVEEWDVVVE